MDGGGAVFGGDGVFEDGELLGVTLTQRETAPGTLGPRRLQQDGAEIRAVNRLIACQVLDGLAHRRSMTDP